MVTGRTDEPLALHWASRIAWCKLSHAAWSMPSARAELTQFARAVKRASSPSKARDTSIRQSVGAVAESLLLFRMAK